MRLDLVKNSAGDWNFSGLQHLSGTKKTAGGELLIEQFVVKDGMFQVNGQGAQEISFQLFNLATNGSQNAELKLSFEDAVRNGYTLSGTARPGPIPAFDLALEAPQLSLNRLAGLLKLKNSPLPEGSNGKLQLTAALEDGRVRAAGRLDFSRGSAPAQAGMLPDTGSISFKATYSLKTDGLSLESFAVTVGNLIRAHAAGTIEALRSKRRFAFAVGIDELNLAALTLLLPEEERRKTTIGGRLQSTEFHIAGTGSQGLSRSAGQVTLTDVSLQRGGGVLFQGAARQGNNQRGGRRVSGYWGAGPGREPWCHYSGKIAGAIRDSPLPQIETAQSRDFIS